MASDQAHKLAYYDPLTELPNRVAFANRVDDILLALIHSQDHSALVMFININNFSDVNSTFGFAAGVLALAGAGLASGGFSTAGAGAEPGCGGGAPGGVHRGARHRGEAGT